MIPAIGRSIARLGVVGEHDNWTIIRPVARKTDTIIRLS